MSCESESFRQPSGLGNSWKEKDAEWLADVRRIAFEASRIDCCRQMTLLSIPCLSCLGKYFCYFVPVVVDAADNLRNLIGWRGLRRKLGRPVSVRRKLIWVTARGLSVRVGYVIVWEKVAPEAIKSTGWDFRKAWVRVGDSSRRTGNLWYG